MEDKIRDTHTTRLGDMKIYNSKMFREFPRAMRHHNSLFPNNYLDIEELKEEVKLKELNKRFLSIIEDDKSIESNILKFIKENKAYHIIGSIFEDYNFGHQDAYLFRQFQLGNS